MADTNLQALIDALNAYGIGVKAATTESTSGSTITQNSGTLIDSSGNTWSINASGVIVRAGTVDTTTSSVIKMAYVNKVIYQENITKSWWSWTNNTWVSTSAPL